MSGGSKGKSPGPAGRKRRLTRSYTVVNALGAVSEYSGYQLPEKMQKSLTAGLTGKTGSVSAIDPYDLNGDGVLSYEELQAYLEAMGLIPSSSSFTLETDLIRTTSTDMAMAAYQISAGSGTGMTGIDMTGTFTYTPIDIMV